MDRVKEHSWPRVGGCWPACGDLSLLSTPDRRSGDDECGLRSRARELERAERPEAERREGDLHDLIRSMPAKGSRLPDWFAHRRAVEVRRIRCTGVVLARGRGPTSCGERLPSPWWDEVTVNRSGGTTIESGGPRRGRDAARNVARPARRHRRLNSRRQPTGHRTELRTVARADRCGAVAPVAARRPGGSRGWRGSGPLARRTMSSSNGSDAWFIRRGPRAEHAAQNTSVALTAGRADRVASGPRRACTRPGATTNPGQRRRAAWWYASGAPRRL